MADSRRHPDVETLDGYADGSHSSLDVDRHVLKCTECRGMVDALRRVRADLAGLADVTMPPDVATRIQAALEAEGAGRPVARPTDAGQPPGIPAAATSPTPPTTRAPRRSGRGRSHPPGQRRDVRTRDLRGRQRRDRGSAAAPEARAPSSRAPSSRSHAPSSRSRAPRLLAALAAACLVASVAVVGVFAATGGGRDTAASTASSSAEAPAENLLPPPAAASQGESGDAADTGDAPVAAGGRSAVDPAAPAGPLTGPESQVPTAGTAVPEATVTVAATGTRLSGSGLERHANDLLAGRVTTRWQVRLGSDDPSYARMLPPTPAVPPSAQTRAAVRELTSQPLLACYHRLTRGNGGTVLALDRVGFLGETSVFVVSSVPDNTEFVHVWIINIDCGADGAALEQKDDEIVPRS